SNQDYSRNRNAGWLFRVRLSTDHYIHRSSRPIQGQRPNIREHHHIHGPSRPIHGQLQYIREHDDIYRPPGSVPRIDHHIPRASTALCRFRLLTQVQLAAINVMRGRVKMSKFLLTVCAFGLLLSSASAQEWTKEEKAAGLKTNEYTRHIPA